MQQAELDAGVDVITGHKAGAILHKEYQAVEVFGGLSGEAEAGILWPPYYCIQAVDLWRRWDSFMYLANHRALVCIWWLGEDTINLHLQQQQRRDSSTAQSRSSDQFVDATLQLFCNTEHAESHLQACEEAGHMRHVCSVVPCTVQPLLL